MKACLHRLEQRLLKVAVRLIPIDIGKAENGQHRADVHVLTLNRSLGTINGVHERKTMLCLVVKAPFYFEREHFEIVFNDGGDFGFGPVTGHGGLRMSLGVRQHFGQQMQLIVILKVRPR